MTTPNGLDADRPSADGSKADGVRTDGSKSGESSTGGAAAAKRVGNEDVAGTGGSASGGVTIYRWTCPICGESRTGMASGDENPAGKAAFSLRQHVRTTDGEGHGDANRFPHGFDPDAAGRAVSVE